MSYTHIEMGTKWGEAVSLKSKKMFSEKYRIGYGNNGEIYEIRKRGGMYEATCRNPNVEIGKYMLVTRTLKDMNKKLGELK